MLPLWVAGMVAFRVLSSHARAASEGEKPTSVASACAGASTVKRKSDFCDPGRIGAA